MIKIFDKNNSCFWYLFNFPRHTSSVFFLKQTGTPGFRPPFNRASIFAPPHLNIGRGRLFPSRSQQPVTPNRSRRFHRTRRGAAIVALVSGSKRRIHQPADYFETWKHRKSLGVKRERQREREIKRERSRVSIVAVYRVYFLFTPRRDIGCGAKSGPQCFMEIYVFYVATMFSYRDRKSAGWASG